MMLDYFHILGHAVCFVSGTSSKVREAATIFYDTATSNFSLRLYFSSVKCLQFCNDVFIFRVRPSCFEILEFTVTFYLDSINQRVSICAINKNSVCTATLFVFTAFTYGIREL